MTRKAMTRAEVEIIEGEQGSGKTNTAVGELKDAADADPDIKIFTNFHLYGIKYVYADLARIVEYLNSKVITDGYIVIDESYIGGDARMGMTLMTKVLTWFGSQIRKRGLHLILIAQHSRMIDYRFRLFMTKHTICSYNEKTRMITLSVVERGKKKKRTFSYYAPQYWKYYDTNEIPQVPENLLAKVLVTAR
tara:strand:+ start:4836 stop:5411 length:576 start_codon:yes stop_codon:yes gene_type:complete